MERESARSVWLKRYLHSLYTYMLSFYVHVQVQKTHDDDTGRTKDLGEGSDLREDGAIETIQLLKVICFFIWQG